MPRPYSLDKTLGTSTATRLHYVVNAKSPDPTRRADSFDSLDGLVEQLPPGDAASVIDFVDRGTALPFGTLNRLRDGFTPQQMADLIGLDQVKVDNMANQNNPDPRLPPDGPPWLVPDAVWGEAEVLLNRLNPPIASATKRMDQRKVVDAVVNRALTGVSYGKLSRFGNAITLSQSADRWFHRDAYRPLIALLVERCPELETADWSRPLSKCLADRFAAGKDARSPVPERARKRDQERVRRQVLRVQSGNLAERFGVEVSPTPLGALTIGKLSVGLYFDPRPMDEVPPAKHVFGNEQRIVFASTAGVGDIGKAIAQHLQRAMDQQTCDERGAV